MRAGGVPLVPRARLSIAVRLPVRGEGHLSAGRGAGVSPDLLREAFWWSATRTADEATAVIKFSGGRYQTGKALAGRRVEVLSGPFDLTVLHVRYRGRDYGTAVPLAIGAHAHPKTARQTRPHRQTALPMAPPTWTCPAARTTPGCPVP